MTSTAIRQIEGQLEKVVIHLIWHDTAGKLKHGTAFFVTAEGVALTAFHNIEDTLVENPAGPLMGRWQGRDLRFRWKLPEANHADWQREHEIAVLQAEAPPIGLVTVGAGYLHPKHSEATRNRHWAASRVVVAGFARGQGYNLAAGDGHMQGSPLCTVAVGDKRFQALRFGSSLVSNGVDDGPGLSGSPVYSPADGSIVGVTIAARTELYAAELWPVYSNWEDSESFLQRLQRRSYSRPGEVRVKWVVLAACVVLAVAAWMWWRQTRHSIPQQLSAQVTRLQKGTEESVKDDTVFRTGEQVRFRLTSPKDGHLYVVDQEIVNGKATEPLIIFPTLRTGAGRNLVKAGTPVDFPDEKDDPSYLDPKSSEKGYEGELLTLLIFPDALPITLKETPVPLEPALFSLDGLKPRLFVHPLAPSGDAVAIRRIRLRVTR